MISANAPVSRVVDLRDLLERGNSAEGSPLLGRVVNDPLENNSQLKCRTLRYLCGSAVGAIGVGLFSLGITAIVCQSIDANQVCNNVIVETCSKGFITPTILSFAGVVLSTSSIGICMPSIFV